MALLLTDVLELLGELRVRQSRLQTLVQMSCELSRIQPLESMLDRIADACGRLLQSDSVDIRVLGVTRATSGA